MRMTIAEAPIRIDEVLSVSESKRLGHAIEAKIKKVAAETKVQLKNFSISQQNAKKLTEKLDLLNQGRFPEGVKPFKLPFESIHFHSALEQPVTFELTIAATSTIAEAKRKLYGEYLLQNFKLDLLVEQRRHADFKKSTSLEHYTRLCEGAATAEMSDIQTALQCIDAPPCMFEVGRQLVSKKAAESYKALIVQNVQKTREAKEATEKKKLKEQKALEAASKLSANEVLVKAVTGIIAKTSGKETVNYTDMLEINVKAPTLQTASAAGPKAKAKGKAKAKPKNTQSPGEARGKGNSKGQSSGKTKGQGKGKGNQAAPPAKGGGKGAKGGTKGSRSNPKAGGKGSSKGSKAGDKAKGMSNTKKSRSAQNNGQ
jgi:hypothetical protein